MSTLSDEAYGARPASAPSEDSTGLERQDLLLPHERVSVFISSRLGELKPERDVARRVIAEDLNLHPVLFEAGAGEHPPREKYQAWLRRSDIVVAVYWEGYGYVADGMEISGLHDELELARKLNKPLHVYLKRTEKRDARLQAMISSIENGVSFAEFDTPEEFGQLLKQDLARLLSERFLFGGGSGSAVGSPAPVPAAPDLLGGLLEDMGTRGVIRRPLVADALRETLRTESRLVLTGPPGVGKTFMLGMFGQEVNGIYISLANQTTQQVCQHLTNRLRILRGEVPQNFPSEGDARAALQDELAGAERTLLIDHADQNPETAASLAGLAPFRCSLIFTSRASDPNLFGSARPFEVPSFTREEVQAFLDLKGLSLPLGERENLRTASGGNPLYLYYFATQQVSPLPAGLHAYQAALIAKLEADARHAVNLIAISLVPLQTADLHTLLRQDGTLSGPPTRTQTLVKQLGALVRTTEGRLNLFHPHFREFVLGTLEQDGLTEAYHRQLAELAINKGWTYPAAYHLHHAADPRELDYLPEGARIARLHGRWRDAEVFARRLIEIAQQEEEYELLLDSKLLLSELLTNLGRHEEARQEAYEALALARERGATEQVAGLEMWSSTMLVDDNQPDEAISLLEDMLAERERKHDQLAAGILFNLSYAYQRAGRFRDGAKAAERARRIFLTLGLEDDAYRCFINLCGCLLELGQEPRAVRLLESLLAHAQARRFPREEAAARNLLAKASRHKGESEEAIEHSREAVRLWQRMGVPEKIAMNLANLGNALKDLERYQEAERAYLEALQLATDHNLHQQHAHVLELMGALCLAEGRASEAVPYLEQALTMHRRARDQFRIATSLDNLAEAYEANEQCPQALEAFSEVGDLFGRLEKWDDAANAFERAAKLAATLTPDSFESLLERAITAALHDRDAVRVLELLQLKGAEDEPPPYSKALERLLATDPLPRLGLFVTNVVQYAKTLSPAERTDLIQKLTDTLVEHATHTGDLWPLGGIGAALMVTGDAIPDEVVAHLREQVQSLEGIYHREYAEGSSIWTLGLPWTRPMIVQLDAPSADLFTQRLALALTLFLAANGRRLGEAVEELGGNQVEGHRFILLTLSDFEENVVQGREAPFDVTLSQERPAIFFGYTDASGAPQPDEWVILQDNLMAQSDVTEGVTAPPVRFLVGELTMNLVRHCTGISEERDETVSLVGDIFRTTFF